MNKVYAICLTLALVGCDARLTGCERACPWKYGTAQNDIDCIQECLDVVKKYGVAQ